MKKNTKSRKTKLHLEWVDERFEVTLKRRTAADTRFVRKHPVTISVEPQVPVIPSP